MHTREKKSCQPESLVCCLLVGKTTSLLVRLSFSDQVMKRRECKTKKSTYANDKKRQFRNICILPPFFLTGIDLLPKNLTESQLKKVQHLQHVGTLYCFYTTIQVRKPREKLEFWLFFFAQELMWKKLDCQQLTTGSSERSFRHDALNWVLQILVDDCNCWFSSASLQIALQCISPL